MKNHILIKFGFALLALFLFSTNAQLKSTNTASPRFEISFPASASKDALDGRLLLLISTNDKQEPRLQISEDLTTQQVFGVNVDGWKPRSEERRVGKECRWRWAQCE